MRALYSIRAGAKRLKGAKTKVESFKYHFRVTIINMAESTWANREDLTKATIDILLREVDGIERLGEAIPTDSVPYPVTGVDVLDAVRYILEKNIIASFANYQASCNSSGTEISHVEFDIPLEDRARFGRSTPVISFEIAPKDKDAYRGRLLNFNHGEERLIIQFENIPRS